MRNEIEMVRAFETLKEHIAGGKTDDIAYQMNEILEKVCFHHEPEIFDELLELTEHVNFSHA